MNELNNFSVDVFLEAKKLLEAIAIPREEIWVTSTAPKVDSKGELVITRVDTKQVPVKTITDADFLTMVHPSTWAIIEQQCRTAAGSPFGINAGIPVFDDEFRREYFKEKRESEHENN